MTKKWICAVFLLCVWGSAAASAQSGIDKPRAELLYSTHCIACHNEKVYWRDKKIAKNWTGLKAQVRRWQGVVGQTWSDRDIAEVAHYLNVRHYHYPEHVQ